jgi:Na+-transporting methylmalonyl-CoA/oxaloacetate decarboxylase gamma subunit
MQESMLALVLKWLGPTLMILGCGGLMIVLSLAALYIAISRNGKQPE